MAVLLPLGQSVVSLVEWYNVSHSNCIMELLQITNILLCWHFLKEISCRLSHYERELYSVTDQNDFQGQVSLSLCKYSGNRLTGSSWSLYCTRFRTKSCFQFWRNYLRLTCFKEWRIHSMAVFIRQGSCLEVWLSLSFFLLQDHHCPECSLCFYIRQLSQNYTCIMSLLQIFYTDYI